MQRKSKAIDKHRVITMLNREELEFLDRLGKDSLFSTGHKLSYNEILEVLVDAAMESGITAETIGSLNALKEKMLSKVQESKEKPKEGGLK